MGIKTFTTRCSNEAMLTDQMLGSAYNNIKFAIENMDVFNTVEENKELLLQIAENIDDILNPHVDMEDIDNLVLTDTSDEDIIVYKESENQWVNRSIGSWIPVSVLSGQITIDLAQGDRFIAYVAENCVIQLPANPRLKPFLIRIVIVGSNRNVTFAPGWLGVAPFILAQDGDETILSGIIVDDSPNTTAIINLVKALPN